MNFNNPILKEQLISQLKQFKKKVSSHASSWAESIGVLAGLSGMAIFYFEYSKFLQDRDAAEIDENILTSCIDKINEEYSFPSYCNGIALTLSHVSNSLNDVSLRSISLDFFDYCSMRRSYETSMVSKVGICHGAFGNAQIYNYLYWQTKRENFKETAEFWIEKGLEFRDIEHKMQVMNLLMMGMKTTKLKN